VGSPLLTIRYRVQAIDVSVADAETSGHDEIGSWIVASSASASGSQKLIPHLAEHGRGASRWAEYRGVR
jgi:hypothetical protein